MLFLRTLSLAIIIWLALAVTAMAQNTAGVFGPSVKAGDRSVQYRIGINPDTAAGDLGMVQRLHYQQSIDGSWRWRVVAQARKTAASDVDFDFLQAELMWQVTPDGQAFQTGLRLDGRIRDESRPGLIGLHWTNDYKFGDGWNVRGVVLTSIEVGDNSPDGLFLQTRGQIAKKLEGGPTLGVDLFNVYGSTKNMGSFKNQTHSVGPFVSTKVSDNWGVFAGALFGLSDASPDTEFRLWVSRSFD